MNGLPDPAAAADPRLDDLAKAVQQIRDRIAARFPSGNLPSSGIPLVDLTPLLQARDAAESKVAAIGTVNPRPPGLLNNLAQAAKRAIARGLNWFVRDQIEFNRAALNCVQASMDALHDVNRLAVGLSTRSDRLFERLQACEQQAAALADLHSHWIAWRREWEHKLATNEVRFLRSVADLEAAHLQRLQQTEANYREIGRSQHRDFEAALERTTLEIQKKLWADLDQIRSEYERLIRDELRLARQRVALTPPSPAPIDNLEFGLKFRGPVEYVRRSFEPYIDFFRGCQNVLDIGCGRGEFLTLARDASIPARGIDLDDESVGICRAQGLDAIRADLFTHLHSLPGASLDGLFCAQVVEHLPPARLPEFLDLASRKTAPGGRIVIETPNPQCLAIFSTHFYIDPTHTRPVPPPLLFFYLKETGFGRLEIRYSHPAVDSFPSLAELPDAFRQDFFNCLDYAVLGSKL